MYYESFLNSIQPSNVIPESASFNDMAIFANRAIQDVYNETAISLVANEMSVFESVMLHEEDDGNASASVKKSTLDKIKKFFADIWARIKEFFQKIIDKIKKFFEKKQLEAMNRLMKKYNDAIAVYKNAGAQAKNDEFGYAINPSYAKGLLEAMEEMPQSAEESAKEAFDVLKKLPKENKDSTAGEEALEKLGWTKDKIKEEYADQIKDGSLRKIVAAAVEGVDLEGNTVTNQAQMKITGQSILSPVGKALEETVRNIKKWLEATKKSFNNSKKAIDKMMKQARDIVNINHRTVRTYCKACNAVTHWITKYIGAITRVYKKLYSDGVRVVKKVIAGAKKWQNEKKSTNESYEYNFNSYSSIDEGFDFYLEEDEESKSSEDDSVEDFDMED